MSQYTNQHMFNDIKDMYEEVKNPTNNLTKQLLEDAKIAWEESDRLGIPDEKADDCVNYFINKYPLLATNCPYIFKVCLLKERYIDLNLVTNALALERAMAKKQITKENAEIAFGKQLAEKYFPTDVYKEVESQMDSPSKVKELKERAEKSTKNDS